MSHIAPFNFDHFWLTKIIIPPTTQKVPTISNKFKLSPPHNTAINAANKGEVETTDEALDAPIKLIALKFKSLPPGKVINPATINHIKASKGSAWISEVCNANAITIVTNAEEHKEINVAALGPKYCMPPLAKTALAPNPKAAPIERNNPASNKFISLST